jgi:hypothetical protein
VSSGRKRVEALQAALAPVESKITLGIFQAIDAELNEAADVRRTSPERRRHLLQLLHFCRSLDSALKAVILALGVNPQKSMGLCLQQLRDPPLGLITGSEYQNFYDDVCKPRNRFMHEASAFPNSTYETSVHLGNIESCFCQILKLI